MSKRRLWRSVISKAVIGLAFANAAMLGVAQEAVSADVDAKYKDKFVMLQHYACERELRFDADGKLLGDTIRVRDWTECQGMRIRNIGRKDGNLQITGKRVLLFYDCGDKAFREVAESTPQANAKAEKRGENFAGQDVSIVVELSREADDAAIIQLMGKLFGVATPGPHEVIPDSQLAGVIPANGSPFRVGYGVTAPVAVYFPDPEYSEEARKASFQGTVALRVIVGPDGHVHNARVARSLGMGLDEKAIEKVMLWRFKPATKCGNPVAVEVEIEIQFRLLRRV